MLYVDLFLRKSDIWFEFAESREWFSRAMWDELTVESNVGILFFISTRAHSSFLILGLSFFLCYNEVTINIKLHMKLP